MRTFVTAIVLGVGVLVSGTAMANENFGGSPLYNPQYSYYGSPYYGAYPNYWNYTTGYPNYYPNYNYAYGYPGYNYGYGYPYYGWYTGAAPTYWDPTTGYHPYSRTNPNWIPYVGWR